MKRKLLFTLIALCCTVMQAWAYDFSAVCSGKTLYFTITDATNRYVKITYPGSSYSNGWAGYTKPSGTLTIPSSVTNGGSTYTVTEIGAFAFYQCTNLSGNLVIPNSVVTIGQLAFCTCSGLSGSLTIPQSVTSIGESAFSGCSFNTVYFNPTQCTTMGSSTNLVFSNCSSLTKVVFGNNVLSIPNYAFKSCNSLTSIHFGSSLNSIGYMAFWYCSNVSYIYSDAVTPPTADNYSVFTNISTTIPIYVPCGSETSYQQATGWSDFSHIYGHPNHILTVSSQNTTKGTAEVTQVPTCGNNIPAIVSANANVGYGFSNWTENGAIVSTDNPYSFTLSNDRNLVANFVSVPSYTISLDVNPSVAGNVTGGGTFNQGTEITVRATPNNNYVFLHWREGYTIASTNAEYTFTVNSGRSLTAYFSQVYYDFLAVCSTGQTLYYKITDAVNHKVELTCPGTPDFSNGWSGFQKPTGNIVIPSTVTYNSTIYTVSSIGDYAFTSCSGLTGTLTIPNTITSIGNNAFYGCNGFSGTLILSNTIESIGTQTFGYCTGFTGTLNIPNSVTSIGGNAFKNCSNLNAIELNNSTPPTAYSTSFSGVPTTIPVNIPCGATSTYQAATGWSSFTNYQEQFNYTLTVSSANTNMGSVAISQQPNCSTDAIVTATPNAGHIFVNWTKNGNVVSTGATYNFTVTENTALVANFDVAPIIYAITASANPTNGGTASGTGNYEQGTNATLTANANTGYTFVNWTENNNVVSINPTYSFTVNGNRNLVANFEVEADYLTLTATQNNTSLGLQVNGSPNISTLQYSYDGINWISITGTTTFNTLQTNEYVKFRSTNQISNSPSNYINFKCSGGKFKASGNANTLINYLNVNNAVLGEYAFYRLFYDGNSDGYRLINITDLNLPTTTMASYCYNSMFYYCKGLTSIPSDLLPATILADNCYSDMFHNCAGLTSIPSGLLPATTMVSCCYCSMFAGCTGLTSVPSGLLPATTLAMECYGYMFWLCSGLTNVPSNLLSSESLANYCYFRMFEGCTSLTTAPELPATALKESCYGFMFKDCNSLISVTTHTTTWNSSCAQDWLSGVSATGNFYNLGGADIPTGTSGIPEGWTEHGPRVKTITAVPNDENFGAVSGAGSYLINETCTLTATPNSGYTFVNWTENDIEVSTDAEYSFTVESNRDLVANFVAASPGGLHWNPDPYQYADNMDIIAQVQIDGVTQNTTMIEVGAFCGNEVRGSTRITYSDKFHKYIVNLKVYGESNDVISFKIYDHQTATEPNYRIPATVTFTPNAIIGNNISPYIIGCCSSVLQSNSLAAGWNWYSSFIDTSGEEGFSLLTTALGDNATAVKSQTGISMYYSTYNVWDGSLTTFGNEQMYMIQMSTAATLELEGHLTELADTPLTLQSGWNWISYPSNVEMPLDEALATFSPADGDCFKSQTGVAIYYAGYGWDGSLSTLSPGLGYMYKNNTSSVKTLTYSAEGSKGISETNSTTDGNYWQPDIHTYPDNMNIIASVSINGEELSSENFEIGVFSNGECRGSARLVYKEKLDKYIMFLTVYGNEGDNLSFRLYDTATNTEYDGEVGFSSVFTPNAIVGSVFNPYIIDFGVNNVSEHGMSEIFIYPNPARRGDLVNIGFSCERIQVVNSLGVVIKEYTNTNKIESIDTAGMYYILLINGNSISYNKLVVE